MSPRNGAPQKYKTTCRQCADIFTASPTEMPRKGETPPARVIKFVRALADHLSKRHRTDMDELAVRIQDFSGFVIINSFETEDPGLIKRVDDIRHDIHTKTQKFFLTDDAIETLVGRIQGLSEPQTAAVTALLAGVKNMYEETEEFSPNAPTPATLHNQPQIG